MTIRTIVARYPRKSCPTCGKPIAVGDLIRLDIATKKVLGHATCPIDDDEGKLPTPIPAAGEQQAHKGWTVRFFDGLSEYTALKSSTANAHRKNHEKAAGVRWYGVDGPAAVRDAVANGWPAGAARISEISEGLELAPVKSVRRKRVRADFGDELDIHAVNSGRLDDAWFKMDRRARSTPPRVTLCCALANNSKTDAAKMFYRGAVALALATALEVAGYSVEIVGMVHIHKLDAQFKGTQNLADYITLKPFNMPCVASDLAATLALLGFFRHFGFKAISSMPYPIHSRYGQVQAVETPKLVARDLGDRENLIVVDHSILGKEAAEQWLKTTLESIQGKAE